MNLNTPMAMHADVMKASPEDDEGKARLFDALKERGGSEFKNKRLDCAVKLYERALKFASSTEQKCVIHSNISLTYAGMKNGPAALGAADAALGVDSGFAKGHFRRGQALVLLKRIPDSHAAFERASELEPDNKMFAKGVRLSQKRLDAYVPDLDPEHTSKTEASSSSASSAPAVPAPATTRSPAATASASSSTNASATTSSSSSGTKKAKSSTKTEEMRGYKVVNGKKTSYFHHEMTEEEKRLIGDITPQRIDPATQVEVEPAAVAEGMSKWNSKGTFEDRDLLPWAKQQLPNLLLGNVVPCGSCEIRITKVKDIEGLCSIAFIQKRKRFLYELSLTLDWEAQVADSAAAPSENGGGEVSVSKGTLKLKQLCHDDEDGDDIVPTFHATKVAAGKSDAEAIKRSVVNRRGDFFKMVVGQLMTFRKQFFAL